MPLDPNYLHADTPHEKSVQQFTRYGCWNKPREKYYVAPDREYEGRYYEIALRAIKNVMSKECRYDFRATDGLCEGCKK